MFNLDLKKAMKNTKYRKLIVKDEHSHGFMQPFSKEQKLSWFWLILNFVTQGIAI
jgi:hypothetical protein